ncbi:MAG TPA: hypothetical protein VFG73_04120 [Rhodanobacteraceae bacterium]|nr:hypothetical protein [Rhodanobacteraceae bacterium]
MALAGLLALAFTAPALACLPCDGYFDPGFANGGRRLLPLIAAHSDDGSYLDTTPLILHAAGGKILIAGSCEEDPSHHPDDFAEGCIVRLLPDGSTDYSFGPNTLGTVSLSQFDLYSTWVHAAALAANGDILLAVQRDLFHHQVVRLSANGRNMKGKSDDFTISPGTGGQQWNIAAMRVQPDGKILLAGSGLPGTYGPFFMAVVRMRADLSSLDADFGTDGRASVVFDVDADGALESADVESMVLQDDGRIVLAGGTGNEGAPSTAAALARLTPQGELDLSFGDGTGRVTGTFGEGFAKVEAMALDRQGRLLIGGTTAVNAANGWGSDMIVNRLLADGSQDPVFGYLYPGDTPGPVVVGGDFGGDYNDGLTSLLVQDDGNIIALGAGELASGAQHFEAVRLDGGNGTTDALFGVNGASHGDFGCASDADAAASGGIDAGGAVVVGYCHDATGFHYGIARLFVDHIFGAGFEP